MEKSDNDAVHICVVELIVKSWGIQSANCKTNTIQAVQKNKSWHVLCKIAIESDVKKSKILFEF